MRRGSDPTFTTRVTILLALFSSFGNGAAAICSVFAPALPMSLAAAVDALDADGFYRKAFGDALIAYLVMMKRFEIGRYEDALITEPIPDGQDVSDWEMREYFEFF